MFKFIRSRLFDKAINSSKYRNGCSNLIEICKATILDMDTDCSKCNRYECSNHPKHIKIFTVCSDDEDQDYNFTNTIEYILACRGYIVLRDINDIIITDNYAKYHYDADYPIRFSKQKISMSDAIMVVNSSDELSTRIQCEIDYAISIGKKVYYMYNDNGELSDIP